MEEWDAKYIHNKFSEVHARLDIIQNSVSQQTHLLERKLETLTKEISDLKKQGNNGSMKMAGLGGVIAGGIIEFVNLYLR